MIDKFSFGKIKIKDKIYEDDVIVFWDGRVEEKERSHLLTKKEIEDLMMEEPDVIVVGKGSSGLMRIEEGVEEILKEEGIELVESNTDDAVKLFNDFIRRGKKAIGVFHLTC